MNTKNNRRRRESQQKIETVFVQLLQTREISQITVSDICKETGLNRSTFYANYLDIYDLADKIRDNLKNDVASLYIGAPDGKKSDGNWVTLFEHIRDNRLFYQTYFKLGYDNEHDVNLSELCLQYPDFPESEMGYHVEFFKAGFNAIVKMWLKGDCKETPEQMSSILKNEYKGRKY